MEQVKEPLQVLLDSRKYNSEYIPNKDQLLWTINASTIATNSNFVILTGLPKTGKSVNSPKIQIDAKTVKVSQAWSATSVCVPLIQPPDPPQRWRQRRIRADSAQR